jgi:UDP-4-amino-4,6-dideoxy-N-acetyl-beta-L-altrosamine transaminase
MIPYGRHHVTEEDIEAVEEVLRGGFLTQGPLIQKFEQEFASYVGAKYAVAVANGTGALHLSALALGVKPGSRVITTPITFAADGNCILYGGGEVVFSDIDPETYILDIKKLEDLLSTKPKNYFSGVVVVDLAGYAANLEAFSALAKQHGLWIIEDACHAPGGYFLDSKREKQRCGNGAFADLSVFSFHPVKHITTGEGGMITTNNEALYKKLLALRTHGITKDPKELSKNPGGWYQEMHYLGFNYRLTEIQAALGLSQLKRADEGLTRRKEIARKYRNAFQKNPNITLQQEPEGHAYHLYIIRTSQRLNLYNYLRKHEIYAQVHYVPMHLHPYYKKFGWKEGDFPEAEKYYETCLSLPMFPTLTDKEQDFVIEKVLESIG